MTRSYSEVEYLITEQGQTWDVIAYDLYGDEFLASDLIELNPKYAACLIFSGGEEIKVPVYDDDVDWDSVAPWRRPQ